MNRLSFNNDDGAFFLTTDDLDRAEDSGLTLSRSARGANGEFVYYTGDYDKKPVFNPYAVMQYWQDADPAALAHLESLIPAYNMSWAEDTSFVAPTPNDREPMPFQNAGVEYSVNRKHSLIGDEMGLGKTMQAIMVANAIGAQRVLVLCPASIRINWCRKIREWSTIPNVRTYPILKSSNGVSPLAHYVVCSYDLARNLAIHGALCQNDWDLLVLDEGHYLKTIDAQRTRAIFGQYGGTGPFTETWLSKKARHVVALTGTPLPNRPRECYTMARGMNWESIDYMSQDAFRYRFNPSKVGTTTRADGSTTMFVDERRGRLSELHARLRCNILVRRLKADVQPQLPDKRYEMAYIEPNGAIKEVLAKEALIDFDPDVLFSPDFSLDGTPISTLRKEMGVAKLPRVVEHLKYLLDIVEVPKIVVLANHHEVMDGLIEALAGPYGVQVHRGGMSTVAKDESVQSFVTGKARIFLLQLQTAAGIDDLQYVSSYVVFAEPDWTPGNNEQCIDRLHRIGQHDNVVAEFIVAEGSFDEKVLHSVIGKAQVTHEVLDRRF